MTNYLEIRLFCTSETQDGDALAMTAIVAPSNCGHRWRVWRGWLRQKVSARLWVSGLAIR